MQDTHIIKTMDVATLATVNTENNQNITENMENTFEENRSTDEKDAYKASNNIDAKDLDQELTEKLKGDTIGNTLYSQSFVLKTLLKFSDLKWDEEVENDLCFLWDMTLEEDVCKFLLDMSYPSIACSAVLQYDENNRFVEIVIGILANIFCSGCENTMTKDQISIILSIIQSDDSPILIQLMRFMIVSVETTELLFSLIDETFLGQLCFILKNSLNNELLLKTLETFAKLTSNCKINEQIIAYNMYETVMMAYQSLTKTADYSEIDTKEDLVSIKYMLETITNMCTYIDRFSKHELLLQLQKNSNIFANEVMKILSFYSREENLIPVTDNLIFYMSAITYIFVNLKLKYIPELFISVTKILEQILDIRNEVEELFDSTLELECYLISCTEQENIQRDLKLLSRHKVKRVLNVVNENYTRFGLSSYINDFLIKYYKGAK